MAGETSDIPAAQQADWILLSMSTMSASTLGLPSAKPKDCSSLPELSAEPAEPGELPQEKGVEIEEKEKGVESDDTREDSQHMEPFHENLNFTNQEENMGISPGFDFAADPSKKTVKVSWWKRQVIFSQPQSHKYNAVLSIALIAAVVSVAIMGHCWYKERAVNNQLRLELAAKDEKLSDVMQQVKEAVTGRRRIGVSRSSFF
ncbi:hypothetical protein L7F22_000769 [Adiantum nelumboides]|nr:hypothetical protein [Adiantum nelumboides]